jgi:hypothetical protein
VQLSKAREFSRHAVASALKTDEKETASGYEADAALGEGLFRNPAKARQRAAAALALANPRDVEYGTALALALTDENKGSQAQINKMIDDLAHRGIVQTEPIGALAHLQLARADLLQGDSTKARVAYKEFLALWKDADPDVPILKQAKAEYAKLQ